MTNKYLCRPKNATLIGLAIAFVFLGRMAGRTNISHAASTITVNSTADVVADDGDCTLREAITASNTDTASGSTPGECVAGSGADTIEFAISGAPDFTNDTEDGYTIAPSTPLPSLTQTVTIDGYSQPGSRENTAVSPDPLNSRLLIEIDGSNTTSNPGLYFASGSEHSTVKGLVINRFSDSVALMFAADHQHVYGNYIGTSPDGLTARPNNAGLTTDGNGHRGSDVSVGSPDAKNRNLISGNYTSAIYPADDWVIQGNYIGVDVTGVAALGNSSVNSGAISVDVANNVLIGGDVVGATNVISGNYLYGVSPAESSNVTVQGNYIGVDATGLKGLGNAQFGVFAGQTPGFRLGGTNPLARNIIAGNGGVDVFLAGSPNSTVQNNYIGTDKNGHVTNLITPAAYGVVVLAGEYDGQLIGGTTPAMANIIAGHAAGGIVVEDTALAPGFTPTGVSILGNSIYDNSGVGIDLTRDTDGNFLPDEDVGTNPNTPAGNTPGRPNSYLNHPVLLSATFNSTAFSVNFDLPVTGSTTNLYRVEFFANDTAGTEQGKTYLGSVNTYSGSNLESGRITLPFGVVLTGKYISATVAELNTSDVNGGLGSTSEFGGDVLALPGLPETTQNLAGAPNTGMERSALSCGLFRCSRLARSTTTTL